MRILIYALPRTDSNNLTHYIANSLHYKEIIEPYNEQRFWDKDLTEFDIWERDNVVVKMIIGQGDYWYEDIKLKFDKMSSNNMKLYLEHIYDIKLPDNIELPDRKFRVAKIQSIIETCINNELSIEECIKQIIETQQEEI